MDQNIYDRLCIEDYLKLLSQTKKYLNNFLKLTKR